MLHLELWYFSAYFFFLSLFLECSVELRYEFSPISVEFRSVARSRRNQKGTHGGGAKRVEEGLARADLRLFGPEHSPAGSGCDPAARSRSHQSLSATWRTRPQTSDRLGSIRGAAARSPEARQHSDPLLPDRTKALSSSTSRRQSRGLTSKSASSNSQHLKVDGERV